MCTAAGVPPTKKLIALSLVQGYILGIASGLFWAGALVFHGAEMSRPGAWEPGAPGGSGMTFVS